ncbi:putative serine/threonine protein kinase, variant 1 [Trichoderma austrokoningii]
MAVSLTLVTGHENKTAAFAEAFYGDLSLTFRFDFNISRPLSVSSRIVACLHGIEVDDENKTFPDRESMRRVVHDLVSRVWPYCAASPSIRFPDVIIRFEHGYRGELTSAVSHESVFLRYLSSLLPFKLGGRGGTTITYFRDPRDIRPFVYKGLSFRLFLSGETSYETERQTFLRELETVFSLPNHPNIQRHPAFLVTTASYGAGQWQRVVCGTLYPYFRQQSLQEVIDRSNASGTRLPLMAKAKWAFQLSSAMAAVHSSGQYHMDLKPSNMLLNNEDDIVVIDWEKCGASGFFCAPEGNGLWDVEVVPSSETDERRVAETTMKYRKSTGPPPNNNGPQPRRSTFQLYQLWQRECPRALEAAEVYSAGKTLWVILEQKNDGWCAGEDWP